MEPIEQFTASAIPVDTVLLLSFYVLVGIYVIFSIIFHYHWRAYAIDDKVTTYTLSAYYFITVPIVLVMIILQFIL